MRIEKVFLSNFCFEVLNEVPSGDVRHFFFPSASELGGRDGVIVNVLPAEGGRWVGTFAFGQFGSKEFCGIFSSPNPDRFCVVSNGQAYIASSTNPLNFEVVPIFPVMDVAASRAHNILIFVNYTEILAFGADGIAWRTKRISLDGLKIISVTESHLVGSFWDMGHESERSFSVDLSTGIHVEGDFIGN